MSIKDWRKVKDLTYSTIWRRENTSTEVGISKIENRTGRKWRFMVINPNMMKSFYYKNRKDALKTAREYMRRH